MATKTAAVDAKGYRKFGFRDVLAYGLGDFGCNMSFALKGTLTIFWTQYMGIDSILMASLLLLVQVWDAINDPVIGAMVDADKRQYKRNKFLAYIWAGSVGLLVAGALCFVPWTGAPYVVKCILFVAGYILWDAFYTVANVPYGSMLSLITADPVERAKLSTGRSVGSMAGSYVLLQIILPMPDLRCHQQSAGRAYLHHRARHGHSWLHRFPVYDPQHRRACGYAGRAEGRRPQVQPAEGHRPLPAQPRGSGRHAGSCRPVHRYVRRFKPLSKSCSRLISKTRSISGLVAMSSYVGLFLFIPFVGKIVTKFGAKEAITVGRLRQRAWPMS